MKQYPNYFDKVIFAQALEFYKSPISLIKLLHKSLKPGGQLFLSTWATPILSGVEREGNFVAVRRPSDNKLVKVFFKPRGAKEVKTLLKKRVSNKLM